MSENNKELIYLKKFRLAFSKKDIISISDESYNNIYRICIVYKDKERIYIECNSIRHVSRMITKIVKMINKE